MIRYALLGLVQGLTEFLPVSSSGHLVLAQAALGLEVPGAALEAAAHLGTLLALLVHFRRDLMALAVGVVRPGAERRMVGLLLLATVPVVVVGLLAREPIGRAFDSPPLVGGMLLVTALALALAGRRAARAGRERVAAPDALAVGGAQAAALLPGLSRSGATVAAGIACGLLPSVAARFSFLLAIPAIAGASGLALVMAVGQPGLDWAGLAVALGCASLSGALAIRVFLRLVRAGLLWPFAIYCAVLGLAALVAG